MLDTKPGAVKPINAFYTLRYAVPFLTVKFLGAGFQMRLQAPVETLPCPRHRWSTSQHDLAESLSATTKLVSGADRLCGGSPFEYIPNTPVVIL